MITINLRPGTTRRAAKRGSPFAGLGTKLKGIGGGAGSRDPMSIVAAALWAVVILGGGYLFLSSGSKLSALEPQLEEARTEQLRYQTFRRQKRMAERARDSVLAQIGTISTVDRERYIWPHILDQIGAALPSGTWLTEINAVASSPTGSAVVDSNSTVPLPSLRIVGNTGDLANYTTFLRRLEASPWLQNVLPVEAKTVIDGNRAMTNFTIQATYSVADSSDIRTVPIIESVKER